MSRRGAPLAAVLVIAALAGAPAEPARGQEIVPFLSCARVNVPRFGVVSGFFGYHNKSSQTVTIPVGPRNFFSPGVFSRGQPTTFLPDINEFAFRTSFLVGPTQTQITWALEGPSGGLSLATLRDGAPTPPPNSSCGSPDMFWAGTWQPGVGYLLNDVVSHSGNAWVAEDTPGTTEPGVGPAWQPLVPERWVRKGRRATRARQARAALRDPPARAGRRGRPETS